MSRRDEGKTERAARLGLVLWEFEVTFPTHEVEDERHWCESNPEFAAEIRGYAEAARRFPLPDEDECRADAEAVVDHVLGRSADTAAAGVEPDGA